MTDKDDEKKKCYFCPSTVTKFCTMCKKWFCDDCRKNYPKRVTQALRSLRRIRK